MTLKGKIIAAIAALALTAAAGHALTRKQAAPEVRFALLSGEQLATSELRGKVVLVNFWATSCVTCVNEMPQMVETWKKFSPRGYDVVAVAMSYDHPNLVAESARTRALPFKVALDTTGEIAQRFGDVRVTPTTFLIDKRGRILKRYLGEPNWPDFNALLDQALAEPA